MTFLTPLVMVMGTVKCNGLMEELKALARKQIYQTGVLGWVSVGQGHSKMAGYLVAMDTAHSYLCCVSSCAG